MAAEKDGPRQGHSHSQGGGQTDGVRGQDGAGEVATGGGIAAVLIAGRKPDGRVPFLSNSAKATTREQTKDVADSTAQTIYIDADPKTVMNVIADIGSYPQWVSEDTEAEVLDADAEGYPKTARLVLEANVLKDTMVLSYDWPPDHKSVRWRLVSSSLLRSLNRAYRLSPTGSGTDVTYELSVDLLLPMIGLLKRKAERRLTDTELKDLKKRVEAE